MSINKKTLFLLFVADEMLSVHDSDPWAQKVKQITGDIRKKVYQQNKRLEAY